MGSPFLGRTYLLLCALMMIDSADKALLPAAFLEVSREFSVGPALLGTVTLCRGLAQVCPPATACPLQGRHPLPSSGSPVLRSASLCAVSWNVRSECWRVGVSGTSCLQMRKGPQLPPGVDPGTRLSPGPSALSRNAAQLGVCVSITLRTDRGEWPPRNGQKRM